MAPEFINDEPGKAVGFPKNKPAVFGIPQFLTVSLGCFDSVKKEPVVYRLFFIAGQQPDGYLGPGIDKTLSDKFFIPVENGNDIARLNRLFGFSYFITKYPWMTAFNTQPDSFLQNYRNHAAKITSPGL